MRLLIIALSICVSTTAFAKPKKNHTKLVAKYEEPDTWANRANFFFGASAGVAIPQGADGLASSAGIELGIAPDSGIGFGLHAVWMDKPPGAPAIGIEPARWGFGATANLRYYFETIGPLSLFPSFSIGFLAGPDRVTGLNQVMPLIDPGIGAKVRFGPMYCTFEFGLSGFTIPFVGVSVGYEGDRHADRAEAWAREQEEAEREAAEEREEEGERNAAPPAPPPPAPAS
jgi:hypothetical protein